MCTPFAAVLSKLSRSMKSSAFTKRGCNLTLNSSCFLTFEESINFENYAASGAVIWFARRISDKRKG